MSIPCGEQEYSPEIFIKLSVLNPCPKCEFNTRIRNLHKKQNDEALGMLIIKSSTQVSICSNEIEKELINFPELFEVQCIACGHNTLQSDKEK
jgi:hypothetical protein